jgi:hypothetical protein
MKIKGFAGMFLGQNPIKLFSAEITLKLRNKKVIALDSGAIWCRRYK